jgi:hypothetical protein
MLKGQPVLWVKTDNILDRRNWVKYLIIIDAVAKQWGDILKVRPDAKFFEVLNKHVDAYVNGGVLPPAEIASVVMNIGDDIMSGRDIEMKAGDYIAVQNFVRKG